MELYSMLLLSTATFFTDNYINEKYYTTDFRKEQWENDTGFWKNNDKEEN